LDAFERGVFMDPMIWVWAGVFVVTLLVEGISAGLISIWFSAGALVAGIATLLSAPLWLQIVLFIVVSGATLIATRPLARKLREQKEPTNADRNIGAEAVVLTPIEPHTMGTVNANGLVWNAVDVDGGSISAGEVVIVKDIQGTKLFVKKQS